MVRVSRRLRDAVAVLAIAVVSSALILAPPLDRFRRFVDRHTHVAALARQFRDLLGEAQHRNFRLLPSPGQRIAVGQSANIRSLNVYNDPDDVVRAASGFTWRELDSIRVQGRDEPISIYEPVALHGEETPEQKVVAAAYAHVLACWRRPDFVCCAEALAPVAAADPPSTLLLQRAKKFLAHPPAPDWDAVNTLEGKRGRSRPNLYPLKGEAWIAEGDPYRRHFQPRNVDPHPAARSRRLPPFRGGEEFIVHAAIASSRRLVTGGPNTPITTNTIAIAPAMKLNTPSVP